MPKPRNSSNKRYPEHWRMRRRGNRYYISYRVPCTARPFWDGKSEVVIGKGDSLPAAESEAFKFWADKVAITTTPHSMGKAFDRYEAEVIPSKSPASVKSNLYSMRRLRSSIPLDMPIIAFQTHHAYEYRDNCARLESPKKANLDIELLSHVFTKCLEWGTPGFREHPIIKKMKKLSLKPRQRYVEDWEVSEFLTVANPMLKVYVPLKYALGIDQGMMLRIRLSDIKEDRLLIPQRRKIEDNSKAKSKEYLFYDINGHTTGLKELLDSVEIWRRAHCKVKTEWVFPNQSGKCFAKEDGTASGFQTTWQRYMKKALKETNLKEKFTEHDITAKTASDADTLEEAARLRGHLNHSTTLKTYRRRPEQLLPLQIATKPKADSDQ